MHQLGSEFSGRSLRLFDDGCEIAEDRGVRRIWSICCDAKMFQ
jgi:hypothetical protein